MYICSTCEAMEDLTFDDFIMSHNHIGIFRKNKRKIFNGNFLFFFIVTY